MCTVIVYFNDLFMGKVLVGKRWLYMADIGAIDLFCHGIMGQFVNIGMTVSAGNIMMDGLAVDMLIHIIIDPSTVFINSAQKMILVTHETIFFVRCLCREASKQENEQHGDIQANFYIII